jgi:SlyX protein
MPEDRIVELEIKVAHQDMAIEELNQTIIQQQSEIANLQRYLELIRYKIENIQASPKEVSESPPPHY